MTSSTENDKTGFYPWLVWGLAAGFYCYGFFQRVAPSVMVNELMVEFSVSAAALGNLSAFYFYAYASLQLPIGVMIDHWGARRMLVGAAILCGAGSLLFAKADSLTMAYLGRLLIGAGAGFTWVGTLKLVAQWMPPKRFAMVSGMTLMLGMIGAIAGQAPLAAAVSAFGWRDTLSAAALVAFALAVLIWLIVRERVDDTMGPVSPVSPVSNDDMGAETRGLLDGLKETMNNRQSWYAAIYGGTMTASILAFAGLWGVPYLMQAYGLERPAAAASTSLMLVGWGIGAPLFGWVSDRIEMRRLPMLVCSVIVLFLFLGLVYIPDLPLGAARTLLFLHGFFNGGMVICFAVSREHNRPKQGGVTLGFVNMMVMSSGAFFQPFIGWLLDVNWDGTLKAGARVYSVQAYEMAFFSLVACGIVAIVMAFLLRETHCRNVFNAAEDTEKVS
ncbi:MAG: MFS transporter [Rhodospirillales bacterium]|nr:MFS transporter [Rhodospirillales bacterium]